VSFLTKNITLAINEDLLDKVRVLAAMKRTSVNELVRVYLQRLVDEEQEHDAAREELLQLMDQSDADLGGVRPSREATYSGEPRFDRWR
jgi:hypothetical protein